MNRRSVSGVKVKSPKDDRHFVIDLKDMEACAAVSGESLITKNR